MNNQSWDVDSNYYKILLHCIDGCPWNGGYRKQRTVTGPQFYAAQKGAKLKNEKLCPRCSKHMLGKCKDLDCDFEFVNR